MELRGGFKNVVALAAGFSAAGLGILPEFNASKKVNSGVLGDDNFGSI